MKRTNKILLSVVLAIFVALGIASLIITSKFDGQELKKYAVQILRESYQRELIISEDIQLQIFPTIAIVVKGVSLSNSDKFPKGEFIRAESVKVNVSTWPLLLGNINVEEVKLDGVVVSLLTTIDGRHNWEFNRISNESPQAIASKATDFKSDKTFSINIDRVDILHAKLAYKDDQAQATYLLEVPKALINQANGKTNFDIGLLKNGVNLQAKGQINPFDELLDVVTGQNAGSLNTNLKLMVNQQSIDINGSWNTERSSLAKSITLAKVSASIKANLIDASSIAKLITPDEISVLANEVNHPNKKDSSSNRIFSSQPIPWAVIPNVVGELKIDLKKLNFGERGDLGPINFDAQIKSDQINIPNLNVSMGSGKFEGSFQIKNYRTNKPQIEVSGKGENFNAQNISALGGVVRKISGGSTDFGLNVTGGANSLHEFASTLNGQSQIVIGKSQLAASALNQSGDLILALLKVIDPRRNHSQTTLNCMAAYLPIKNGIINVPNSIGIETDQLYLLMSGVINLKNETLALDVKARDPSGLTTGISLASMVRLQGSMSKPQVGINKAGVARQGVNIGLGVLTVGVSILAENAKSIKNQSSPCQDAMRSWIEVVGR